MRHKPVTFLLFGLVAGLISVTLGGVSPVILAYGGGPVFFAAVLSGVSTTGAWYRLRLSFWRYFVSLLLSITTYTAALFSFSMVMGFSPVWIGLRPSANIFDFGIDVWLGLIAAGIVAAIGTSWLTALFTGGWSTSLLLQLVFKAIATIVVTFVANLAFHSYWSFFGPLLLVGNGLFCWVIGRQIWLKLDAKGEVAPTAPTG